jgi:hypothetical protein
LWSFHKGVFIIGVFGGAHMTREKLYDELYNQLAEEQKELNLCQWCKINGRMTCLRDKAHVQNGCCGGCKHFNNGCTVESLVCKMWMCKKIYEKNKGKEKFEKYLELLKEIEAKMRKHKMPLVFRGSKEETFSCVRNVVSKKNWYIDNITVNYNLGGYK